MSASKKTTTKSAKSPAPATRSTAAKPAAAKKTTRAASVQGTVPVRATPAAPIAPKKAAPAAVKAVASKPVSTSIRARVDVGFGNALFLRGDGPGLGWDKGVAMQCVSADLWQIELPESARGYTVKFLVNDERWSTGPDFIVVSGESVTLAPEF